jgi:2-polyprenyl-3-methyl-5-hydroxy-6-metoxy-1,4-benzoquinol methylase
MSTASDYQQRLASILAPTTGELSAETIVELSQYLGWHKSDVAEHLNTAEARFADEWRAKVKEPRNERDVIDFYDQSETEIFEIAQWHVVVDIHVRSLICSEIAARRSGRRVLDYGSGIGSDALVFASAGFDVTLADVSGPLLKFAEWRLARHGYRPAVIDLKEQLLPEAAFDVVVCFDVLEHVLNPIRALRAIRRALRPQGLLFLHAPFGPDPLRPMHIVHRDMVSPRIRSLGFANCPGEEREFPSWLWFPHVYQRAEHSVLDRLAYRVWDSWLPESIRNVYRQLRSRMAAA